MNAKQYPITRPLLVILGLICLYGLVGSISVPWLVRQQLNQWTTQHPQLKLTIQQVRYNPFFAKLTLSRVDLSLTGFPHPNPLPDGEGDKVAATYPVTQAPLFHAEELSANLAGWTSLWRRGLILSEVYINQPRLDINRDISGLFATSDASRQDPWLLQIDQLLLEQGHIQYQTDSTALPFTLQLQAMRLQLRNFSNNGAEPATLVLTGRIEQSGELSARASLNLETPLGLQPSGGVLVGAGRLQLNDIALTDTAQSTPLIQAPALEIRWNKLDVPQHQAHIASISANHAQLFGWLNNDGGFNYARYLKTDAHNPGDAPGWHYQIDRVSASDAALHLQDRSRANAPTLALTNLSLSAQALSNGSSTMPFQLNLDSVINEQGHLQIHASGTQPPVQISAELKAEQITLLPLNAYLQSIAKIDLLDGDLDLGGHLEYRADGKPQLQFNGESTIHQLQINRQNEEAELLKWRRLIFKDLRFSYPDPQLHATEIIAEQPYAQIVIEADKSFNWTALAVKPSKPSPTSSAVPITIDALRIRNGVVEFADHTLQPDFATTIHSVDGAIKNLNADPNEQATLLLEGKVDEYSPVRVQGLLNPLRANVSTDIEMQFRNLDLTRLSPYSGKFAGYRIDKGKLTLDLRYRLENRKLEAENQVIMDHLTLGERVDSKQATSLPIGLAIALLRDADGKIDIHLPISGNLDDPHFSLGDLYAQAITGLITKLITSPFTALGNLLEGDAEEYGRVAFFPGKALLSAYQKEKLLKLAMALQQRSGLTLEIRGVAVPERDLSALAEVRLHNHVHYRWREELRNKGETLTRERRQMRIPDADYQRLLLVQYSESGLGHTADHHQAWRELLEKFSASETDLRLLAQKRATRIREFLIKDGGISEQRVFLLDAQLANKPDQALESLLLLNGSP